MRNAIRKLVFGLFIISLTACIRIEEVEIREIKSVKLLEFSDQGLLVESNIKIYNPNDYDIKVVGSDFNIEVNDHNIGNAHISSKLEIPASSNEFHSLRLKSSYKDLRSGAIPNLIAITASGDDQLDFKVKGEIVGKVWWFKKRVEVGHEGKVDLKLF